MGKRITPPPRTNSVLTQAARDHTIARARGLIEELAAAVQELELFALETPGTVPRIDRAWVAWNLGADPARVERAELFDAIEASSWLLRNGEVNVEGLALRLLSLPSLLRVVGDMKPAAFEKARAAVISLLEVWPHKKQRFGAGDGPWPRAAKMVFVIWGEHLTPDSLRVEFNKRRRPSTA